jgi:hypothetical protein
LPKGVKGFQKGNAGRPKGCLNKPTRAVKEFLAELCDDPDIQMIVKERIMSGDITGFFRALEMVIGKPKQQLEVNANVEWMTTLPPGDDVAES